MLLEFSRGAECFTSTCGGIPSNDRTGHPDQHCILPKDLPSAHRKVCISEKFVGKMGHNVREFGPMAIVFCAVCRNIFMILGGSQFAGPASTCVNSSQLWAVGKKPGATGFEPVRAGPNGFQVQLLNHSDKRPEILPNSGPHRDSNPGPRPP